MSKASVEPIYADALNLAKNLSATPKNLAYVASATSTEAARWAFIQWSLRQRAESKFELASEMLFDRDGLEMATHERLAEYHASEFPTGVPVCDLTVGIGADMIALARRGPALGYEIDNDRADLARHNLRVHGLEAEVINESWETLERADYYFLDPARREGGRRTLDPSEFLPNPLTVIERFRSAILGVVKLSPMLPDSFLESIGSRLEFLSLGGECREALVIVGNNAKAGRFAVHVETGEVLAASDSSPHIDEPGEFLHEADPAAIRAHSLGTLAEQHDLRLLGDSNGYLTGEHVPPTPWLKSYRVVSSDRFDLSELKKKLNVLGASTPVLKQKGAGQDLDALRRKLNLKGTRQLLVALYPVGKSVRAAVLEPLR
jgi:hypothetical protein